MNKMYTHIKGCGAYLPKRVMTNESLCQFLDTSNEWILERTGIEQRHIIANDQQTSDLAVAAAQEALLDAGLSIDDIDVLIVATTTPDMVFPSTASIVQHKLGGKGFPAWDIQAVCSGFVFGLAQLDGMMRAGMYRRALLIGAESMTRLLDWNDRNTCVLFGDGAGAVVLECNEEEGGILGSVLHSDGAYCSLLQAKKNHSGASPDQLDSLLNPVHAVAVEMRGNEVFRIAVRKLGEVVEEILELHNMKHADIDWLIPHQANQRIINATAKKLSMPLERVAMTVNKHANTSSASVPLALHDLYKKGSLQEGQMLLLEAFGAGFAWGANLIRWSKK
ncbi:MAG: beta-ketoacyl-ACP synthase III [Mariprofundaceae bacterium]|nr:beta-ketoacyl-ACP synthase III [Mariprofundaceae bacterium]